MADGRQRSKKSNDPRKMSPSSSPRQPGSHKASGERRQVPQAVVRNQGEQGISAKQPGLAFRLSGPQLAQVLRALLEQNLVGVAIVNPDGGIQHVNRALADLLHYKEEELVGQTIKGLVGGPDSHRGTDLLAGERRESPALNQIARKSGETISCLIDSHAIHDGDGKVTHFMVFASDARSRRDIVERNRFERGLYRAQALQVLGTLAGGVAHDFNNCLEVIIGFASLARTRLSVADPLHEPLKIIEESAKGAAGLVRQLLDVSKDKPDDEQDIDVGDLIKTVFAIVSRTFDRRIRIEHRIDPQLPGIKGIRNRLEQAILNLCINARDAMPEGGSLTLEATSQALKPGDPRLPPTNDPGSYVRISIHDDGVGMTAEVMEHIFVPLFTTKGPGQGSGLGLAMVDRFVKEGRGFVAVASKPGEGSEFSLYLPAVSSKPSRGVSPWTSQLVPGRGRILVVDDEPRVLEFLQKGLSRLGYEVVAAESGNRACEIYARDRNQIDCVLLDLIMPGMSGVDTFSRLRGINPHVRVILSSGYSSGRLKREALGAGSPEFLEKPYTLEELSRALQKTQ